MLQVLMLWNEIVSMGEINMMNIEKSVKKLSEIDDNMKYNDLVSEMKELLNDLYSIRNLLEKLTLKMNDYNLKTLL